MNRKKAETLYEESVNLIRKYQHSNGGFYASPPGERYPHIYSRGHSVIILASIEAGLIKEAKRSLKFILNAKKPSGEFSQRYDVDGIDTSYKGLQIDGNGLALFALGGKAQYIGYSYLPFKDNPKYTLYPNFFDNKPHCYPFQPVLPNYHI